MTQASRFRALLHRDGMVVAPGAYDCITAKLIEQAGFAAVYMTGAGTAATLGYPDFGLVTMSEMVANAGRIAAAVELPVIADADTGYGNELNAFRAAREFERSGVAGIHIEDQEFPKKCGHLEGKEIIPREDWLAKIGAASGQGTVPPQCGPRRQDAGSRSAGGREDGLQARHRPRPSDQKRRRHLRSDAGRVEGEPPSSAA